MKNINPSIFSTLYDGRFNFQDDDKPFLEDANKNYDIINLIKNNLKHDFKILDSCRCFNVPNLYDKKYLNTDLTENLKDNPKLFNSVINYFNDLNANLNLNVEIPESVNENENEQEQSGAEEEQEQSGAEEEQNETEQPDYDKSTLLTNPMNADFKAQTDADMKYASLNDIAPYNLLSGKVISFNDVCMLTLNIARTQLMVVVTKDENILFMEEREKQKLQQELNKYIQNNNIKKMFLNVDISNLNLKQLQYYTNQCKDMFESLKVMDIAQHGLELFDLGYKSVFPNGIKVKNKRIKLDGTLNAFNEILFDRNSTAGISFKNVINKYNIHVSDELNTALSLLGKMAKHITVETIPEEELKKEEKKEEEEEVEKKEEVKEKEEEEEEESKTEEEEEESEEENETEEEEE